MVHPFIGFFFRLLHKFNLKTIQKKKQTNKQTNKKQANKNRTTNLIWLKQFSIQFLNVVTYIRNHLLSFTNIFKTLKYFHKPS